MLTKNANDYYRAKVKEDFKFETWGEINDPAVEGDSLKVLNLPIAKEDSAMEGREQSIIISYIYNIILIKGIRGQGLERGQKRAWAGTSMTGSYKSHVIRSYIGHSNWLLLDIRFNYL